MKKIIFKLKKDFKIEKVFKITKQTWLYFCRRFQQIQEISPSIYLNPNLIQLVTTLLTLVITMTHIGWGSN